MKNYKADSDFETPVRGFSKTQIMNLTYRDIERLSRMEGPDVSRKFKEESAKKKNIYNNGSRPKDDLNFSKKGLL